MLNLDAFFSAGTLQEGYVARDLDSPEDSLYLDSPFYLNAEGG